VIIRLLTGILVLACLSTGCSRQTSSTDKKPGPIDSAALPDSEVRGADIQLYSRGELTTGIRAERILKFDAIDSTMAYVLDVDFYDSLGQVTSNLVGDSGIIRENTQHFIVYGHVVVITPDGARLETDSLAWNPVVNKIQTDAFVKLTRDGDVMTGWGLDANKDLTRVRIHDVSGTVSDADQILDE